MEDLPDGEFGGLSYLFSSKTCLFLGLAWHVL